MSDESKSASLHQPVPSPPPTGSDKGKASKKHRLRTALIVIGAIIVVFVIIPKAFHAWHTVSTDDAYVNSYVTFVAPRVSGQVARVLVDNNNRVKKGDVLVELDPEPYRVQVAIKQAAVDTTKANLVVAQATVRSEIGQARSLHFKLQHAIENVDNQVASIRAPVATWEQAKATHVLAQATSSARKSCSRPKYPAKRSSTRKAKNSMWPTRRSSRHWKMFTRRAALGLPPQPAGGTNFADVPPNLDQTFSSVREALSQLLQAAAQLGVVPSSWDLTPKETVAEFYRRDPGGDINKIYAQIILDVITI